MKFESTALLLLGSAAGVAGHGFMYTPRTRNIIAHEESGSGAGVPPPENCEHCLNQNEGDGYCGIGHENYDLWLDSLGNPMPWESQDIFRAGEIISVKSFMSTHHNGHVELKVCCNSAGNGRNCDQSVFDSEGHSAMFVQDISPTLWDNTGMPKDLVYPERGYLAFGQGGSVKDFEMLFQLPEDIYGEECILQWWYVTANSCSPEGYADYFAGTTNEFGYSLPGEFWTSGLSECTNYPQSGARISGAPEQFWNCAEVTIDPAVPTVSPAPTASRSPTRSPTKSSAPSVPNGCCTYNWNDCVDWNAGMINDKDLCEAYNEGKTAAEQVYWLPGGPYDSSECALRYMGQNGQCPYCCPGLTCVQQDESNDYYLCMLVDSEPTTPAPVAPPTTPSPVPPPVTPAPVPATPAPVTSSPVAGGTSNGIPLPCCGWGGNGCEQPENTYCQANESQCTGACNGSWYTGGATPAPTSAPAGGGSGCCTWGGWSTCPSWTQGSSDPCQQTEAGCIACSGSWIS